MWSSVCPSAPHCHSRTLCLQSRLSDWFRRDRLFCGDTDRLDARYCRQVLALDFRRRRAATVVVDGLLGLGGVLLGGFSEKFGSVSGSLCGKVTKLSRLLIGTRFGKSAWCPLHINSTCNLHVVALLELGVNDLLVLDVDERTEIRNSRGNESQAPQRDELDQEVGDQ